MLPALLPRLKDDGRSNKSCKHAQDLLGNRKSFRIGLVCNKNPHETCRPWLFFCNTYKTTYDIDFHLIHRHTLDLPSIEDVQGCILRYRK